MMRRDPVVIDFETETPCKAPIYANKYAMDDMDERGGAGMSSRGEKRPPSYRSQSMPRQQSRYGDRLLPPGGRDRPSYDDNVDMEMQPIKKGRKRERPGK